MILLELGWALLLIAMYGAAAMAVLLAGHVLWQKVRR